LQERRLGAAQSIVLVQRREGRFDRFQLSSSLDPVLRAACIQQELPPCLAASLAQGVLAKRVNAGVFEPEAGRLEYIAADRSAS
jgi:hypothetical protein